MAWRDAIIEVLKGKSEAMHYADIAEEIAKRQLRTSLGATPPNTVNVTMSDSIKYEKEKSPFDRTTRGYYRLREHVQKAADDPLIGQPMVSAAPTDGETTSKEPADDASEPAGLINALGMYWSRDKVMWNSTPRLLGKQPAGGEPVNFSDQRGVYLLYDRDVVIYVGRAIDQGVGTRLKQHTTDRLNGRWDRFSWFGIYTVSDTGALIPQTKSLDTESLIATMEALLIESVEPSQNRRRGDDFRAVEFLQVADPEIEKQNLLLLMSEIQKKLITG